MTLQKIEFEYDIPDGYRFVRYGMPKKGDLCLANNKQTIIAEYNYDCDWIIVEKIPEQEQSKEKIKLQLKNSNGKWIDLISDYEYRIKPKQKTIMFRNYLTEDNIVDVVSNKDPFARIFKKRLS